MIGELARRLPDVANQFLLSRSARDLMRLAEEHPHEWVHACQERPLSTRAPDGMEALESALDAERRQLMHANEQRLQSYVDAAREWASAWPGVARARLPCPSRRLTPSSRLAPKASFPSPSHESCRPDTAP